MSDLPSVLGTVRERIAKFRGQSIGEENTKHALIEPVLKALGWDVEDLDEVRCEYKLKSSDNPVDYALFVRGNLRLFVEAKALGENLDKWANVIMGYTGVAGIVDWIVLTDGNEYRVYNASAKVHVDQKLFRRVVIAADEPGSLDTLALLSKDELQGSALDELWQQYFVDRQVKATLEGLVGMNAPIEFLRLVRKRTPGVSLAEVRGSLGRVNVALDYRGIPSLRAAPPKPDQPVGTEPATSTSPHLDKTPWRHVTFADLIGSGSIRLPLYLETTYKGHTLTARCEIDGTVTWNGVPYDSLSTAAGMARRSIVGAPPGRAYPQTNGWTFWHVRRSDGRLSILDELRRELHEGKVVRFDHEPRARA